MEDIPDSIAPTNLLEKIRKKIKVRENYEREGIMYEDCQFKPIHFGTILKLLEKFVAAIFEKRFDNCV